MLTDRQLRNNYFDLDSGIFHILFMIPATKSSKSAPLLCKNTSRQNELNKSTAEHSLTTLAQTKSQAENILKRNFNYFHPTSGCTAQSGRGALETWSESSTLLVVFCSTAESRGPWSSLANCWVPPHALCAIKDNCANDVQPWRSSARLRDQANSCSRHQWFHISTAKNKMFWSLNASVRLTYNNGMLVAVLFFLFTCCRIYISVCSVNGTTGNMQLKKNKIRSDDWERAGRKELKKSDWC